MGSNDLDLMRADQGIARKITLSLTAIAVTLNQTALRGDVDQNRSHGDVGSKLYRSEIEGRGAPRSDASRSRDDTLTSSSSSSSSGRDGQAFRQGIKRELSNPSISSSMERPMSTTRTDQHQQVAAEQPQSESPGTLQQPATSEEQQGDGQPHVDSEVAPTEPDTATTEIDTETDISEPGLLTFLAARDLKGLMAAETKVNEDIINKKPTTPPPMDFPRASEVTKEDLKIFPKEIRTGKKTELDAFVQHKVFNRALKAMSSNIIDCRWVLRWKWKNKHHRFCRARLCLRGFKDQQKDELDTYGSTASRFSQRIICSMAAIYLWTLTAIDISTAFLQGEEYKDPKRRIHMKVDKELAELLRTHPGFEDFDEEIEVLLLLKSAYAS